MNNLVNKKVLIVGLGLIGGSYAKGLRKKGIYVGAISNKKETIEYAFENGIIDSGYNYVNEDYIKDFDIIVFSLYPKVFINWIKEYSHLLKDGAIVTDVTGVKKEVVYKVREYLKDTVSFIPHHPMAGKEVYGIKNSDERIFKNANFIITPFEKTDDVSVIEEIGELLEFRKISILSIDEHDEMIAFLSQLTHCIAVSLMCSKESEHLVDYTGDSFRDLTRIAKINEDMWTELFLLNKTELLSQMDLFIDKITELRNAIDNNDEDSIKKMMITSTNRRKYFDK